MSANEQRLLDSWISERDAEAFKAIANRYAGLVYATCLRILGNDTEAEDVAQECFMALAGAGRKPGGFLGAWLHRVATNKSLTRIRSERNRQKREKAWGRTRTDPVAAAEHRDLCAVVDEAIARLPDDLRVPLVAHFIEDRTHEAIAADLGVSRQTVTYRIGKGIERVRKRLQVNAVAFSVAHLAELLKPVSTTPASLLAELGKLALAGPVTPVAGVTAFTVAKALVATLAIVCAGGLGVAHFVHAHDRAKAETAWRNLAQQMTAASAHAQSSTPQEPSESAKTQVASSGNATQASPPKAAATPAPSPDDSFQPYSYLREMSVGGRRVSERFSALTPTVWRTEQEDGTITVGDMSARITQGISPGQKILNRMFWPDDPYDPSMNNTNAADWLEEWSKNVAGNIESLGTIQLENKECKGFHAVGEDAESTIWLDTQTNLPVRIEVRGVKEDYLEVKSQFKYGLDIDPALRDMTPPEGYEVREEVRHRPLGYRVTMFWRRLWDSI